jgi:exopolysaccharide production protein ExoZ
MVGCLSPTFCGQMNAPSRSRHWQGVQILRAVAATSVLVHHGLLQMRASGLWAYAPDTLAARFVEWLSGGVDLFFVLSGFVLVQASRTLPSSLASARMFLVRRLTRVLPFWWLALVAMVAMRWLLALKGGLVWIPPPDGNLASVVASVFLVPLQTSSQGPFPILPVGWTLSYEFVFYGLFAASLAFSRRWLLPGLVLAFGLFQLLAPFVAVPALRWFLGNSLWWEFVFGVMIGLAYGRGWAPAKGLSWTLVLAGAVIGLCSLWTLPATYSDLWTRGLPAALLIAGVCGLESGQRDLRAPAFGLELGAASYALYLWHLHWINGPLAFLFQHWSLPFPLALTLCVALPWAFALVFYRFVEAPWLRIQKVV